MRDEQAEQLTIEYEPIGTGGRARLVALGIDTGTIADIDVIDLARASDRTGYARRVAELLGHWSETQLERELLRKDRALAETAALLVLSKKVTAIFNKGEDA